MHTTRERYGGISMTFFSSLAWTGISFLLFTVLVAVISAWKTRDEQLDTAEGYFLAGRGLPGVVIAGSLLLTNLSAEQLVGLNGQSWKTNMGPIAWEVGSMFTLLVLAYYFLPKYLKMGAMTIPSLMEERYGKGTKTMFSLVIVVMYSIPAGHPVLRCSRFRADLRHLRHPWHQQVHGCCHPVPHHRHHRRLLRHLRRPEGSCGF